MLTYFETSKGEIIIITDFPIQFGRIKVSLSASKNMFYILQHLSMQGYNCRELPCSPLSTTPYKPADPGFALDYNLILL